MTVRVAGVWELGYNTPLMELDLWQYPLREFAVDEFVMSPVSGIRSEAVIEVHDLGVWLAKQTDQIVFLDEHGEIPLKEFTHPENCIYVLGKASMSTYRAYSKPGDLSVRIETPGNTGMIWQHQAVVVALYDRMMKGL
jgi:hypothetical protein